MLSPPASFLISDYTGQVRRYYDAAGMCCEFEPLEARRLLSAPLISVTARGAAAYEAGPTTRFFYIRRSGDTSQPLSVFYTVGGKAKQELDYNAVGTGVTIKPGTWLRRVEVTAVDDDLVESNESVTLTLNPTANYSVDSNAAAATIRIISDDQDTTQPLPTHITWTTKAANPIIRAEALRAVVDNKLYVFGGFSGDLGPVKRSDVYDPMTDKWTPIADLPTRVTHAGVAVDGHNVYVAGGYVGIGATGYNQTFGVTDVWRYNVDTNTWSSFTKLPKAMAGGGAAVINHTLHYFGGDDSNRNDAGDHFAIDLADANAAWQRRAALPDPRSHFGTVLLDGKIYAIGGQHGNDAALTTVTTANRYDPSTDKWSTLAPLSVAVSHFASAAFAIGNRIIVAGGETANEQPTNRVTAYNVDSNTWTSLSPLPSARFSGVGAAIDGVIYFTTGSSETTTWKGVLS